MVHWLLYSSLIILFSCNRTVCCRRTVEAIISRPSVNHSYDHRSKWSPLGPITIMFSWSSSFVLPHKALCIFPWFNKMSFALHPSRITITNNIVSSNTVNRGRPILLITLTITDRNEVFLVLLPLCLTEVHPLSFHTKLCAFFTLHPSWIKMIFLNTSVTWEWSNVLCR